MSTPYREPGSLPSAAGYWSRARIARHAMNLVVVLVVLAGVLSFFLFRRSTESRLTLADPKSGPPVETRPAIVAPQDEPARGARQLVQTRVDGGAVRSRCTCTAGDPLCSCVQ